ncbi:MAG: PilZ domain-containing protein [Gammaproteobacteria bacterium]|nr:PilZ domain-containing protein [Gammaproteobacteria bacterium]
MTSPDFRECRKYERSEISIEVLVTMPGRTPMKLKTGNISEGGVFLLSGGRNMPRPGTELSVTLPEFLNQAQPVAMKAVVRHYSDCGIGIEFLGRLA